MKDGTHYVFSNDDCVRLSEYDPDEHEELEQWIAMADDLLLGDTRLLLIDRQGSAGSGWLDLAAIDKEGDVVVVELKRGEVKPSDSIVNQAQNYADTLNKLKYNDLAKRFAEFGNNAVSQNTLVEAHRNCFGSDISLDLDEFNKGEVQLFLIGRGFDNRVLEDVAHYIKRGRDIDCFEYSAWTSRDENTKNLSFKKVDSSNIDGKGSRDKLHVRLYKEDGLRATFEGTNAPKTQYECMVDIANWLLKEGHIDEIPYYSTDATERPLITTEHDHPKYVQGKITYRKLADDCHYICTHYDIQTKRRHIIRLCEGCGFSIETSGWLNG